MSLTTALLSVSLHQVAQNWDLNLKLLRTIYKLFKVWELSSASLPQFTSLEDLTLRFNQNFLPYF